MSTWRKGKTTKKVVSIRPKTFTTLHTIELSDKCDMYKAWQMINEIRDLRKKRRNIKDEKLVLSGIKAQGITYLNRKSVQKCVDGLSNRKYKIRIVEEDEET